MGGGASQAVVHGVVKSLTQLSNSLSLFTFMHWRRKWQPTPVFWPGESQGWWSLVGCRLWGCTELDMTEATQQISNHHQHDGHCLMLKVLVEGHLYKIFHLCESIFQFIHPCKDKAQCLSQPQLVYTFSKFHVLHTVDQMLLQAGMPIKSLKSSFL